MRDGRLVFYKQKASGQQVRKWVAAELGSIQNVCKQFIQAIRADADTGLSASLGIFDVTDGLFEIPDRALLMLGFGVSIFQFSRFRSGQLALAVSLHWVPKWLRTELMRPLAKAFDVEADMQKSY